VINLFNKASTNLSRTWYREDPEKTRTNYYRNSSWWHTAITGKPMQNDTKHACLMHYYAVSNIVLHFPANAYWN